MRERRIIGRGFLLRFCEEEENRKAAVVPINSLAI
jgi:hypothetical protein